MKSIKFVFISLVALLAFVGCLPQGSVTATYFEQDVTINISLGEPLFDVALSVVDAIVDTESYPMCLQLEADVFCEWDSVQEASVQVVSTGATSCRVGGLSEAGNIASYKNVNCSFEGS